MANDKVNRPNDDRENVKIGKRYVCLKRLPHEGVKKIREFLNFFLFLFPKELTDFGQGKNVS